MFSQGLFGLSGPLPPRDAGDRAGFTEAQNRWFDSVDGIDTRTGFTVQMPVPSASFMGPGSDMRSEGTVPDHRVSPENDWPGMGAKPVWPIWGVTAATATAGSKAGRSGSGSASRTPVSGWAYDNRWPIIIGGGVAVIALFLMLRK
jgi:hypothetical protein